MATNICNNLPGIAKEICDAIPENPITGAVSQTGKLIYENGRSFAVTMMDNTDAIAVAGILIVGTIIFNQFLNLENKLSKERNRLDMAINNLSKTEDGHYYYLFNGISNNKTKYTSLILNVQNMENKISTLETRLSTAEKNISKNSQNISGIRSFSLNHFAKLDKKIKELATRLNEFIQNSEKNIDSNQKRNTETIPSSNKDEQIFNLKNRLTNTETAMQMVLGNPQVLEQGLADKNAALVSGTLSSMFKTKEKSMQGCEVIFKNYSGKTLFQLLKESKQEKNLATVYKFLEDVKLKFIDTEDSKQFINKYGDKIEEALKNKNK